MKTEPSDSPTMTTSNMEQIKLRYVHGLSLGLAVGGLCHPVQLDKLSAKVQKDKALPAPLVVSYPVEVEFAAWRLLGLVEGVNRSDIMLVIRKAAEERGATHWEGFMMAKGEAEVLGILTSLRALGGGSTTDFYGGTIPGFRLGFDLRAVINNAIARRDN